MSQTPKLRTKNELLLTADRGFWCVVLQPVTRTDRRTGNAVQADAELSVPLGRLLAETDSGEGVDNCAGDIGHVRIDPLEIAGVQRH